MYDWKPALSPRNGRTGFAQPSIEVVKAIGCRSFGSPAPTNEAKEANQSICETKALETCDEAAPSAILQWQEYEFPFKSTVLITTQRSCGTMTVQQFFRTILIAVIDNRTIVTGQNN